MAIVLVQKDGLVSIVVKEIVPTICMDLTVKKIANVMETIRTCVIHGLENVTVNPDGVAVFVTDLVLSLHTAKIVKLHVIARTVLSVHQLMVLSDTIKKRREFK